MITIGSHSGASIEGPGIIMWNKVGMVMLTFGSAPVMVTGSDENTTLISLGRGDVTFVAGNGNNYAKGNAGNDVMIGGDGYDRFFGAAGDDTLSGGGAPNVLEGEDGDDTILFGQNDQSGGGAGADHFILTMKPDMRDIISDDASRAEFTYIRDLNFKEGDVLDLSMTKFLHSDMKVVDNALMVFGPDGILQIEGVGHEITMAGGIDAAIKAGGLMVYDQWDVMTPFGVSPEELVLIGVEPPSLPGFTMPAVKG